MVEKLLLGGAVRSVSASKSSLQLFVLFHGVPLGAELVCLHTSLRAGLALGLFLHLICGTTAQAGGLAPVKREQQLSWGAATPAQARTDSTWAPTARDRQRERNPWLLAWRRLSKAPGDWREVRGAAAELQPCPNEHHKHGTHGTGRHGPCAGKWENLLQTSPTARDTQQQGVACLDLFKFSESQISTFKSWSFSQLTLIKCFRS